MPQITKMKDFNPNGGKDIYFVSVPAYGATYCFTTPSAAHDFAMRAKDDIKARRLWGV